MTQFGFLVDETRCAGCKACEVACKNRNNLDSPGPRLRQVQTLKSGTFPNLTVKHVSMGRMHCADPACLKVCPAGAIEKLEDGAVVGIRSKCIGCHYCFFACPFGVPQYRPEDGTMIKCDSCYDRRKMGMEPACAHSCFYGGIAAGDMDEMAQIARERSADRLAGDSQPSVLLVQRQ